jgi:peptidoglycan hydrolase CwlO-like protein
VPGLSHEAKDQISSRRARVVALLTAIAVSAGPQVSFGDLGSREQSLQQSISADSGQITAYAGRLRDLQARLSAIESSLAIQRALLVRFQNQLIAARSRLALLRDDLKRDRQSLATQLVAQYESPTPDVVSVVLQAHGFADLLERVDQMRAIARQNASAVKLVTSVKAQVAEQTVRLTIAQARQQRVTAAVLIEREQVAGLRLSLLQREQVAARDRARKQTELRQVRHQLAILQGRAAAAQNASFSTGGVAASGGGSSSAVGGDYGFFPAPGTNYTVGEEPTIAARLHRLGKALRLHLIGISGYRTPQHSVEVGGFADDPHTRGEASDTPGVEGVPQSTLLQFGLTRPFPGPAEADHIQLA